MLRRGLAGGARRIARVRRQHHPCGSRPATADLEAAAERVDPRLPASDRCRRAHRRSQGLARLGKAVCRHYLSNGKREGRYWLVGDVHNSPGRSMFVRLQDSPKGPAGKWTDAATSGHGDLLDIIRESLGLRDFREVAEEARRFLNLPRDEPQPVLKSVRPPAMTGSQETARRLFAISVPIEGTVAEAYLHRRGIAHVYDGGSL